MVFLSHLSLAGKQEQSGEITCLPPVSPRFKSWHGYHMWVDLLLVQLSHVWRGFPLSLKTTISEFQFDSGIRLMKNHLVDVLPLIIIYLSILFTTCLVMQC